MIFEEYMIKLKVLKEHRDPEHAHYEADEILCLIALNTTLTEQQRIELVNIYNDIFKWYA